MTLPRAQKLIDSYETNTSLIHHHINGISDEQSLLQLPFEANCLNWIVGHIVSRRNSALNALGLPELWGEEISACYRTGSDPILDAENARAFSDLVADLDRSQEIFSAALKEADSDLLDAIVTNDRGEKTALEHLKGFHWHETYHVGQLDILRAFIQSQS
ncbi:MAG: DinB family protein [Anaerolineales bacterium]|jgi:hypothetical protein